MANGIQTNAQLVASIVNNSAWAQHVPPHQRGPRVRLESPPISTDAVIVPINGGLYATLVLAAKATMGGTWRARFQYASSADGFAAYTVIGYGSTVDSGSNSLLAWDLGGLDVALTYKVRFTIFDASGAQGATITQTGTFQIDHVATPTITAPVEAAVLAAASAQAFTWTFNDPDVGHAQTAYALRRTRQSDGLQQWWRASDSTWQTVETWNTSAAGSATIGANQWQQDGAYTWAVATRDTMALPSSYTVERAVTFSAAAVVAITAPAAAGNLVTQSATLTWTASEQAKYRARLLTGGGFTTVLQDTGIVAASDVRSTLLAGAANGTTVRFELTVYNTEGLATVVTRDKSVVYTGPTTPTVAGAAGLANPPRASIPITNPAGGDTFASNSILRSDDGGVTYAVIATGIAEDVTYVDHTVGAGRTYSYKVRAYGVSDTFSDSAVI